MSNSISLEYLPKSRNYDLIVVAAANFLFSGFDFGPFADLIEKIDLPCLMVGLGAQAPRVGALPEIKPGTLRFVRAVAARTGRIGVRGAFTAEVLAQLGIKNVEVTGCPSLYLRTPTQIRTAFAARREKPKMVSFNGSRNVIAHSSEPNKMRTIERRIYEQCASSESQFILQSEAEEMRIMTTSDADEMIRLSAKIIESLEMTNLAPEQLRDTIRAKFKIFFDIDAWSESVRACSFSAGTRFHGNLIALLSGIPAHIICHDSRTQELSEFAEIPHSTLGEVADDFVIEELMRRTNIDKFIRRQAEAYAAYVRFMERNGVRHTLTADDAYASVA